VDPYQSGADEGDSVQLCCLVHSLFLRMGDKCINYHCKSQSLPCGMPLLGAGYAIAVLCSCSGSQCIVRRDTDPLKSCCDFFHDLQLLIW